MSAPSSAGRPGRLTSLTPSLSFSLSSRTRGQSTVPAFPLRDLQIHGLPALCLSLARSLFSAHYSVAWAYTCAKRALRLKMCIRGIGLGNELTIVDEMHFNCPVILASVGGVLDLVTDWPAAVLLVEETCLARPRPAATAFLSACPSGRAPVLRARSARRIEEGGGRGGDLLRQVQGRRPSFPRRLPFLLPSSAPGFLTLLAL